MAIDVVASPPVTGAMRDAVRTLSGWIVGGVAALLAQRGFELTTDQTTALAVVIMIPVSALLAALGKRLRQSGGDVSLIGKSV